MELGEYASFAAGWSEAQTYEDTIGDLAFDLLGSLLGAGIALLRASSAADKEPRTEPAAALAGP